MKKLVFSLAVLFSVAMVSCGGNKAAENADTVDTVALEAAEVVETVDSANDTTVEVAAVEAGADSAAAPAEGAAQ